MKKKHKLRVCFFQKLLKFFEIYCIIKSDKKLCVRNCKILYLKMCKKKQYKKINPVRKKAGKKTINYLRVYLCFRVKTGLFRPVLLILSVFTI